MLKKNKCKPALLVAFAFLGVIPNQISAAPKAAKPNIIVILSDDQGWVDTSVQMHPDRKDSRKKIYKTPNLERLAKAGMIFSQGYAGAPQCAPSRGALQFGQTPTRLAHTTNAGDYLVKERGHLLTIPKAIKSVHPEYVAGHLGKWHVPKCDPSDAGYDEHDGTTGNGGGEKYEHLDGAKLPQDDPKQIYTVSKRSCEFIAEQAKAKKPFYLQISHYAVHVPVDAHPETLAATQKRFARDFPELEKSSIVNYAAMIEDLDTGLGMILDELEKQGIRDNTYVLFTSDNGGCRGNEPLQGGKRWLYEGGIRVPFVMSGPQIAKGSFCNTPVVGWDLLPTIYDLVGGTAKLEADLDGGSFRGLLESVDGATVVRRTTDLIWRFLKWEGLAHDNVPAAAAIRRGKYKLFHNYYTDSYELYNVDEDISEENNLIESMPEIADNLKKSMRQYFDQVDAQDYWIHRKDGKKNLIGAKGLEEEIQRHRDATRNKKKKTKF
jgi:arylsulfatase A